ncbi:hypothetical protein [Actinoplanes xinjiangensis]|uniref:hypothetical protein n=1 Tax=Actinoplanes xinjiangensis TaxID=512350 RepID=UPI00342A810A
MTTTMTMATRACGSQEIRAVIRSLAGLGPHTPNAACRPNSSTTKKTSRAQTSVTLGVPGLSRRPAGPLWTARSKPARRSVLAVTVRARRASR